MSKFLKLAVTLVTLTTLASCATIKNGPYDKVEIVSNVEAAYCKIYRDGEGFLKSVSTPGAKYIKRSEKPITITCEKRGFEDVTISVSPTNSPDTVANATNLGLGLIYDLTNAALYHYPEVIEVNFKK